MKCSLLAILIFVSWKESVDHIYIFESLKKKYSDIFFFFWVEETEDLITCPHDFTDVLFSTV